MPPALIRPRGNKGSMILSMAGGDYLSTQYLSVAYSMDAKTSRPKSCFTAVTVLLAHPPPPPRIYYRVRTENNILVLLPMAFACLVPKLDRVVCHAYARVCYRGHSRTDTLENNMRRRNASPFLISRASYDNARRGYRVCRHRRARGEVPDDEEGSCGDGPDGREWLVLRLPRQQSGELARDITRRAQEHVRWAFCLFSLLFVCLSLSLCVYMCACVFIKLHITAQSGPVILVMLYQSD